ncbi:hypothetical protein [Taibaiella koreensis]|uniref:hypothetical protein n=1 Tax=Taibaiella koreensis TaxID=1268548 RepID=UPI000E59EC4D|nr:hypothetical protein [Taibaiella koreensis]
MHNQQLPTIEVYQNEEQKDWHWSIRHPQTGALLGSSAGSFYDREECIENLKFFGRLVTAYAVAQEKVFRSAYQLS